MTTQPSTLPHNFYRLSIKALVLDEHNRFMLTLEKNGIWELPGGGLEFGESPTTCLTREIREEMGLEVVKVSTHPAYFLTAPHSRGEWWIANVIYEVKLKNLNFTPSDECVEVRFFTRDEALKEKLFSNVEAFVKLFDPTNHI